MSSPPLKESSSTTPPNRGRGRGNKSRGGLGKYLRARGRGRGGGRPAQFTERLLLEGERGPRMPGDEDDNEEGEDKEDERKFSRRKLGTNADRYKEPDVELDSDGEPIIEPEVDLSSFLKRQQISENDSKLDVLARPKTQDDDPDAVDHSLAHIGSSISSNRQSSRKGKVEIMEWDETLDEMSREKEKAEATWDLKARFRAKTEQLSKKSFHPLPTTPSTRERDRKKDAFTEAPDIPSTSSEKDKKAEMEGFLDDLLA